ncbi:phage portal protein [Metabacillus sp. HB246100]
MFSKITSFFKGVLAKMGIIKQINKISDMKMIPDIFDDYYDHLFKWKCLYRGYLEEMHNIRYRTLDGDKERTMSTLGMPKVVTQELASLVFNEKCEISISEKTFDENVKNVLNDNKFYKNFQEYLEYSFALGGLVIKPYVENPKDKDKKIKLSFVTADCFIPVSWDNSGIREGVFTNEIIKGKKKFTHLEWHIWDGPTYIIKNELYASENLDDLGIQVPLDMLFPNLPEEVPISNLKRPMFVYIKPNIANNLDLLSPLGISIYGNSFDTLQGIDIAFDSFIREFRLGKKKIIVPAWALKPVIDPQTGNTFRYYDPSDETYEAFDYGNDDSELKEVSMELRVEEHIGGINALLNTLSMQIGFSAGTFSFDGQSVKTATEVVSENSKTFRTKQSHETVIEAGLQELIECIGQVAKLYHIFPVPSQIDVSVTFDDSIAEDKQADINQQIQLVTNKMQSLKRAIMKIHGMTEEDAERLLKEINDEQKTATAENVDLFGMGEK